MILSIVISALNKIKICIKGSLKIDATINLSDQVVFGFLNRAGMHIALKGGAASPQKLPLRETSV
ncbi:MAG: hypothetical protein ACMUIP_13525 [bacterium]